MILELRTERLTLRPVGFSDFEVFYQILTNEFVRRYLCDNEILPPDVIESFIIESRKDFAEKAGGLWLIILNDTSEIIGLTGLRTFFDEPQPQLLYALLPKFTGRGLATEAAQKIIDYTFSQLNFSYLEASCDAPNVTSRKVAEKLGMKKLKEETINELPTIFYRLEKI
jgi:[ribosomal protein S5]-alanine N-acetyltransferase